MQRGRKGGLCSLCGTEDDGALYWEPCPVVLDFGVPGLPPLEPDMTRPVVCDHCHTLLCVREAYREDRYAAQAVYCARTWQEALQLMKWEPTPALLKALAGREAKA